MERGADWFRIRSGTGVPVIVICAFVLVSFSSYWSPSSSNHDLVAIMTSSLSSNSVRFSFIRRAQYTHQSNTKAILSRYLEVLRRVHLVMCKGQRFSSSHTSWQETKPSLMSKVQTSQSMGGKRSFWTGLRCALCPTQFVGAVSQ